MGTSVRITSQGHPHARLRRALATRNPLLVRAAAAELAHVGLDDALQICLVLLDSEPQRYEPAAMRFLGRLLLERRPLTLTDAELAARWLAALRDPGATGEGTVGLAALCRELGLNGAAGTLGERLGGAQPPRSV